MATRTMPRSPGSSRQVPGQPGQSVPPDQAMPRPGTRNTRTRPVSAPRHTRPVNAPARRPVTGPTRGPDTGPAGRPGTGRGPRPRPPRAPFILLLVGLLSGALILLIVISTTLAQGSFGITSLQQQNTNLAKQEQLLAQQVAQASSPARIAQQAARLGMRQDPNLRFLNLKTGKIVSGKVSAADAEIDVPGYNP